MRVMIGLLIVLNSLIGLPVDGQPSILNETRRVEISYEVKTLGSINSTGLEFSPIVYNDQLVFASDREYNLVNYGEQRWKHHPHINLFVVDYKSFGNDSLEFSDPKLFENLFTSFSHTGPITFSKDGKYAVFTQVVHKQFKGQEKIKVHKPALYYSVNEDGKWSKPDLLPFVDGKYSYGHPSFNDDASLLYFSSNAPGGKGGDDIYSVSFDGDKWGEPSNLGDSVNTDKNEVFPCSHGDKLYFSSNRDGGKGGLDIYRTTVSDGKYSGLLHLDAPANSDADDFGMSFKSDDLAYFSSNRADGRGKDDLYILKIKESVIVESNFLAGQFNYRNLSGKASGMRVMLYDDNGELLMETTTNDQGEFIFKNLDQNGQYRIRVEGEEDMELVIFNQNGENVATLLKDANGEFLYKLLDQRKVGTLALIDPEDIEDDLGDLNGQFIFENLPSKQTGKMKVMLVDENGNITFTTTTDEQGNFTFENLPMNQNFLVRMEEVGENLTLLIYNSDDEVRAVLRMDGKGDFVFKRLDQRYANNLGMLEVEENDLFSDLHGSVFGRFVHNNANQGFDDGLSFMVVDKNGDVLLNHTSDKKGFFRLNNLPLSESYMFQLDEESPYFGDENIQLIILNRNGKEVAILDKDKKGFFVYTPLGLGGKIDFTTMNTEDMTLENISSKEIPTIYYAKASSWLSAKSKEVLDDVIKRMKENPSMKLEVNSYADARGQEAYNLELSRTRSNSVLKYLKSKGISDSRIGGNAYGESKLLNKCDDGVDCPEELHQLNRRSEIRLY